MRTHRFYVEGMVNKWGPIELKSTLWLHDAKLLQQWLKVFRFREGQEIILFNDTTERLYRITRIESALSVHVELITELERLLPEKHAYLLWSLLKKDKNEWIVQKATELGVRNLVPLIAERSEKLGFDLDRAKKIAIEAAEQCGRADIPDIREPIAIETALREYKTLPLYAAEKSEQPTSLIVPDRYGVLVGPEGGWSDAERALFSRYELHQISLSRFVLRAETAAVAALVRLS